MRPLQVSPRTGATTSLDLATSPEVASASGQYWVRSKPHRVGRPARDDAVADGS
jgi:hypothetical protein